MRRREFVTVLGGVAAWSFAIRSAVAQQSLPIVGFVRNTSASDSAELVMAFRQGLKETGYVENQNVAVDYRWANNHNDRLPGLVGELVRQPVAVILAGGNPATSAAKAATQTIPIVFSIGNDPIKLGLVASFNHPGGNLTGATFQSTNTFLSKRLEILSQLGSRLIKSTIQARQPSR